MTKVTLSLIFALLFVIASFSKPMIPCMKVAGEDMTSGEDVNKLGVCVLEGEQDYWGTDKLSNPWFGGGVAFILVALILFAVLNFVFPKRRVAY